MQRAWGRSRQILEDKKKTEIGMQSVKETAVKSWGLGVKHVPNWEIT